jgi:exodeoxyribonuclease VII large subunit
LDILSITGLNLYIKGLIEQDRLLSSVTIKGEISNFKAHSSGHMYMSLKDDGSVIKAVMFRGNAQKLKFIPNNGMQVVVTGKVSLYERDGQYQIYISDMMPDGVGALFVAYEQLKEKLQNEGLFSDIHKKSIPKYPRKIGVVTSPTGAAIRDILNILKRRFPYAQVYIFPVLVQGEGAASSIVRGLEFFNKSYKVDTIITGRGGGSIEDLWAFNEEVVARAIYNSNIPIISAVGHETDFTIADFVSDKRVPTPSAAAEIAVPSTTQLLEFLKIVDSRLLSALISKLDTAKKDLSNLRDKEVLKNPLAIYNVKRMTVDRLSMRLENAFIKEKNLKKERFIMNVSKLDALSPLKILKRGYSMTCDETGQPISSIKKVDIGSKINVAMADGSLNCSVYGVREM